MVTDRFIQLLTKELCEQLTDAEQEELSAFLQESQECRDQRQLLMQYWEHDKGDYKANTAMFKKVLEKIKAEEHPAATQPTQAPVIELAHTEPQPRRRYRAFWYSAAAALILTIGIVAYYHKNPKTAPQPVAISWMQKATRPTKKISLTLADSTVITLNSATTIRYPDKFNDSTREVYLDGEAYFDVHKDPARPFIIHAGKINIRVLGTAFNVKSYQNDPLSEASLIKGSIEVTLSDRPSDRIILKPKEKLIVQNNLTIKKQLHTKIDSTQENTTRTTRYSLTNLTYFPNTSKTVVETSWVENKLVFSDKSFIDLSSQLERWYGVHIRFKNDRVKDYSFTGFFEKESLPEALDALKMIEHFNYKIADSTVYIY
ncbi:MAG: FecR family protein [Bacteroidetes bacterium]|nr:FecR family protein [Bacteroidota bacterium]